jgi:hypothetical protein
MHVLGANRILRATISTADRGTTIGNTGASSMALSNSERQRRYRKRRLGAGGKHEQISCLVSISTKRNLERLAFYFGYTITGMIEQLINETTEKVLSQMDEQETQRFFEQGAMPEDV